MVFYLKINREERYVYRNLQHWIKIVEAIPNAEFYILCDNDQLKQKVMEQVVFQEQAVQFLESCKSSPELDEIVENIAENIAEKSWVNVGYAHLTTFWHTKKNNIPYFWNIDADDTCICLAPKRVAELFCMAEAYAKENQVNIMSLDMWTTRTRGHHWSFGITYTDNTIDWFGVMRQYCRDEGLKSKQIRNVDGYFSCLKRATDLKIETFYAENLKFIHYSDDFFKRPDLSGFFHWKDGKLILPILRYCFGLEAAGNVPIAKDVIKLDMQITDQESTDFLLDYALPLEKKLLKCRS